MVPESVDGELGPVSSSLENVMSAVSVSGRLSVPVVPFVFGDQAYWTVPNAGTPGPLSAEQLTLLSVVNVAVYFASVNALPEQPVRVPLVSTR